MDCIGRAEIRERAVNTRGTITIVASGSNYYPTYTAYLTDPITGEITHRTKAMLRKYFVKWIETVPATQILTPVSTLPGILTSAHFIGNDGQVHDIAWLRFHYRDKLSELNDDPGAFEKWLLTEQHYRYYFR